MQTFGPAAVAAVGRRVERPPDRRAARALGTVRSASPPGVSKARDALGGPGPRAPCARCVPRPARKARRAGDARLRAATSLPPQLPGTLSARGRERAELGSGERGGPDGEGRQVARGCSPDSGRGAPAGPDACWYWRLCRVEKITGRPGAALPFGSWAESHPRGAVGTPAVAGRPGLGYSGGRPRPGAPPSSGLQPLGISVGFWGSVCFGFFRDLTWPGRCGLAGLLGWRARGALPDRRPLPPCLIYF